VKGKLYYGERFGFPRPGFLSVLGSLVRSRTAQIDRIEREVARYLETLMTLNSTRILNDFDDLVRESARRLEAEIRGLVKEVQNSAQGRLHHARKTQTEGAHAVEAELARLEKMRIQTLDTIGDG
jgi:hypothetical protein